MVPSASTAARLASRGVLRLTGDDTLKFLQGLVTVDVHRLRGDGPPALYGAFLNRRGRVAHSAFLVNGATPGEVLLDVNASRVPDLLSHLKRHKLRARVQIDDASDELAVLATPDPTGIPSFFGDPRLSDLGERSIVPAEEAPAPDAGLQAAHDRRRVLSGVPGILELEGDPLPLALGLHCLGAVDFDKGCYLGQELTARTHFTGVVRKRLVPLAVGSEDEVREALERDTRLDAVAENVFSEMDEMRIEAGVGLLREDGKVVGKVTSSAGNVGLAFVKLQDAFVDADAVGKPFRLQDGRKAVPWRPAWWKADAADSSAAG